MAIRGYYLGCPGWSTKTWVGRLFPPGTRSTAFLARYAEVFNSVEGNTTFYALPELDTVKRWRDDVPATFRFCFKLPREVTHDKLLIDAADETARFFDRIAPLAGLLGTIMLQLPPRFGPESLERLRAYLDALPRELQYAVEFRHEAFFTTEPLALDLLRERGVDLVIMDTRGAHTSKSLQFADVRGRKPALPVIMRATANQPIVRCVPHEDFAESRHFVEEWVPQLAAWLAAGKRPYFFMHAPDDTFAPENAYAFHAMLQAHGLDVGELPVWPGTSRQLGLF
ncbi:MAG: DUF72 domain-containing protein [Kofleriaceae bacterium]